MKKIKIAMVGPARNVKGGITTVVNNYYKCGIDKEFDLDYFESINDKNIFSKMYCMIKSYISFIFNLSKYDIVHIHMASKNSTFRKIFYIKQAKKKSKKVIVHIHGGGFKKFYASCSKRKKSYIVKYLNLADKVIVLSEEWYDYFSNLVPRKKIEILYNGTEIVDDFSRDSFPKSIVYLGRINEKKGIYDFFKVIQLLSQKYNDIKVSICGSGEEEIVKRKLKELKISDYVELIGWVDDAQKAYQLRKATYFILPSYYEGLPMSLLEAMSYKNVCIATNVGGIPKVIENEKNGYLIEPGNVEKMVEIFSDLFENKKNIEKISENARKTVMDKFNMKTSYEKLLQMYREMI